MSAVVEAFLVAKKKPVNETPPAGSVKKQARFELRSEPSWLERVERQAGRLGMSAAAYIRQAVTRQLEMDESNDPATADD